MRQKEAIEGFMCIAPWLLGFLLLTIGPVIFSFVISLTKWDMINPPKMIGFGNYATIIADDFRFRQSLKVTVIYALVSVPLGMVFSLALAMLLNLNLKGMRMFRAIFYIPAILPPIAVSMVWLMLFNAQNGILNVMLDKFGIEPVPWLTSPEWALPSFILMSLWGVGGGMIIYLAGLQSVPTQLYESAEIDGAGSWSKFVNVTLPMISPTILFNLIMGIIGSFQVFASSFVMTQGGPAYSTLFYVLYLYQNAFMYLKMGYACALAWILFLVILVLTLLMLRASKSWVYYESELRK